MGNKKEYIYNIKKKNMDKILYTKDIEKDNIKIQENMNNNYDMYENIGNRVYNEEGYQRYNKFYSEEFIRQVNEKLDNIISNLEPCDTVFDESSTGKIKQIQYLYNYDKIFVDICTDLTQIAKDLIGDQNAEFKIINMQLFEKHPEISKPTRSHQDNAYFCLEPLTPLTMWLSLDNIDEENGCLYYAPKTHLTPTRNHQRYHKHTTYRTRTGIEGLSICLHEHPEEYDVPMKVKPGDLLVHNCNLIHRAGKNSSKDRRRRAIGIVFVPINCTKNEVLVKYHLNRLKGDIELQKIKDPKLYSELVKKHADLFDQ